MNIEFTAGQFQVFRTTTKIHLGAIEKDLEAGSSVEFDGAVAKIDGKEHSIPSLRVAIREGWLVPQGSAATKYQPKAADIQMRPAQSTTPDRGQATRMRTVHDEERDLGTLKKVRDHGDGIVRKVVRDEASSEGEVVGKIRTAAKQSTTLTGENVMRLRQEILRMDDVQGTSVRSVIPVKTAYTGDVSEARSGMHVEEMLDDALVARLPPVKPGVLGEGDEPHLTSTEKDARRLEAAEVAAQARQERLAQVRRSAGDETTPAAPVTSNPVPEITVDMDDGAFPIDLAQRVQLVRAVIPTFEWDLTRPWRARVVDAVQRYGKNPLYLNGILSVETDMVKEHVATALTSR